MRKLARALDAAAEDSDELAIARSSWPAWVMGLLLFYAVDLAPHRSRPLSPAFQQFLACLGLRPLWRPLVDVEQAACLAAGSSFATYGSGRSTTMTSRERRDVGFRRTAAAPCNYKEFSIRTPEGKANRSIARSPWARQNAATIP